jgi:signal transduction histidine kinase
VEYGLEKKSTDQELAERAGKDHFLSFAIHEIRNPLSAIFSWSELMQNGLLTSLEEVKEGVQIVYSESQQLSRLLDKLQLFFRIESNRQPMAFANVRSNLLFPHLEQQARELSQQRQVTVFFEESSPEAFIWCDESLILQALQNLLENAILYSKPNEEVTVSASCSDALWTLAIEDHAGGIAPELVPLLTEAYRLPMPRKSAQGLGLGIPTAYEIINSHHGVLLFSPTSQGTLVKVSLPRVPAPQLS